MKKWIQKKTAAFVAMILTLTCLLPLSAASVSAAEEEVYIPESPMQEYVEAMQPGWNLGNTLDALAEEDGWGNTAAVALRFQENAVICDITEHASKTGEASLWGLYDGSYLLHRYEEQPVSAEELLSPASGRKTSDFLAELGLDEASFRLQCQPVYDVPQGEFLCLNALQTDPVSYVGKACYIAQDIPSGTMKPLTVVSQQISSDGYPCYEIEGDILLWDVRDAPTDPAVALGDVIYGYLLFGGTQSLDGNQYLSFFLLSME